MMHNVALRTSKNITKNTHQRCGMSGHIASWTCWIAVSTKNCYVGPRKATEWIRATEFEGKFHMLPFLVHFVMKNSFYFGFSDLNLLFTWKNWIFTGFSKQFWCIFDTISMEVFRLQFLYNFFCEDSKRSSVQ